MCSGCNLLIPDGTPCRGMQEFLDRSFKTRASLKCPRLC